MIRVSGYKLIWGELMVIFRVDANSMIGKGHMKRCVTIAKNIKLLGGNVLFVTREDSDTTILENNFMEFRTVPSVKLVSDEAINDADELPSRKLKLNLR